MNNNYIPRVSNPTNHNTVRNFEPILTPQVPTSSYSNHLPNPTMSNSTITANSSYQNNSSLREQNVTKKFQILPRWHCTFSGTSVDEKHQSLEEYIASLVNFMRTQQVSPSEMMNYIYPTLRGSARTWYLTLNLETLHFETFLQMSTLR